MVSLSEAMDVVLLSATRDMGLPAATLWVCRLPKQVSSIAGHGHRTGKIASESCLVREDCIATIV